MPIISYKKCCKIYNRYLISTFLIASATKMIIVSAECRVHGALNFAFHAYTAKVFLKGQVDLGLGIWDGGLGLGIRTGD